MMSRMLVWASLCLSLPSTAWATQLYQDVLAVVDADCAGASRRIDPREGTTVYVVAYTSKYSSARLASGEVFTGSDELARYAEVDQIEVEDAAGEPVTVSVTAADVCPSNGRRLSLTLPNGEGRYRLRFGSAVEEVLFTTEPPPPAPEATVAPPPPAPEATATPPAAAPEVEGTPPAEGSPAPPAGTQSLTGTCGCQTAATSGSVFGLLFVSLTGLQRRRG